MHPVRRFIDTAAKRIKATPEERVRRLDICSECEWAKVTHIAGRDVARCGECGCPLATRTVLKNVHCPKGKW